MEVRYFITESFTKSMIKLRKQGGIDNIIANKIRSEIQLPVYEEQRDPLKTYRTTNHGESRIRDCIKYDLGRGYRLVTIFQNQSRFLLFAGNHESCQRWLNNNKGLTVAVSPQNIIIETRITEKEIFKKHRGDDTTDYNDKLLFERIDEKLVEYLMSLIPSQKLVQKELQRLDTSTTDTDLVELVENIPDEKLQNFFLDVLIGLRLGDIEAVKYRIGLFRNEYKLFVDLDEDELITIKEGEKIKLITVGSEDYERWLYEFKDSTDYKDWMLFLHPNQQKLVDINSDKPMILSGVSGSGKTTILIKRAIRLARNNIKKPILILTLNKSLATLIENLIDHICMKNYRRRIEVKSVFDLAQELLLKFEPHNENMFTSVTWFNEEHVDEIWKEYYRQFNNNNDAACLVDIHLSFNSRNISGETYLNDELDWIRSKYSENDYQEYIRQPRTGRTYPLQDDWRRKILDGLKGWNDKMDAVGVIDHIGIVKYLMRYYEKLNPRYSHILIDEVQDFGTIELKIARRLVSEHTNDIFFTGDPLQKVSVKDQSFKDSGFQKLSQYQLRKNYRNSREIVKFAYHLVLTNYPQFFEDNSNELLILKPEEANFSSPLPILIQGKSLEDEIANAFCYLQLKNSENPEHKGVIAIPGFTLTEIQKFAPKNIEVLDGSQRQKIFLNEKQFFISDLEQMKGFEFSTVIILNCTDLTFPNPLYTEEEIHRDFHHLYVSLTRATSELVISFHGNPSPWFSDLSDFCQKRAWSSWDLASAPIGAPQKLVVADSNGVTNYLAMTGLQYIYSSHAIGLSIELQKLLIKHVTGRDVSRDRKKIEWRDIKSLCNDLRINVHTRSLFYSHLDELVHKFQIRMV